MKKFIFPAAILIMLFAGTLPAYAGGHFRGSIWIGPGWWGPPRYHYYYDPYYPYPPYYAQPPVIIERQPEVYTQPAPQRQEQSYWYFCTNPQGYYPYIKRCPGGWLKVVPPSAPPDLGDKDGPSPDQPDSGR